MGDEVPVFLLLIHCMCVAQGEWHLENVFGRGMGIDCPKILVVLANGCAAGLLPF